MSDRYSTPAPQDGGWFDPGRTNVQLIYVLYLAGFFVAVTMLVGLVMAYLNRGKAGGWVDTHYTWLIRTFWIGILGALVSAVLSLILIGILLGFAVAVWVVVRCVVGLQAASRSEPIRDPQSWWI